MVNISKRKKLNFMVFKKILFLKIYYEKIKILLPIHSQRIVVSNSIRKTFNLYSQMSNFFLNIDQNSQKNNYFFVFFPIFSKSFWIILKKIGVVFSLRVLHNPCNFYENWPKKRQDPHTPTWMNYFSLFVSSYDH